MKTLFTSRKFWTVIIMLIVVVISAFAADFELNTEEAAGMAVIIVSYILGVAVDPGPGGWRGVFQSRKFWAAVVGLTIMFLDAFHLVLPFGLTSDQIVLVCVTFGGYIAGVAFEQKKFLIG